MNSLNNARTLYRFCGLILLVRECRAMVENAQRRHPYDVGDLLKYGFVYFVQGKKTRLVKIGFSTNADRRLDDLQSGSPDTLRMLGMAPGSRLAERRLHEVFQDHRVHGEWFKPSSELLSLAASLPPCSGQAIIGQCGHNDKFDTALMKTWSLTTEEKSQYLKECLDESEIISHRLCALGIPTEEASAGIRQAKESLAELLSLPR